MSNANTINRQPVFFISHGGGPWPWMPNSLNTSYKKLAQSLEQLLPSLSIRPEAILMISAHWEEPVFTVQSTPEPEMIYDYSGFPEDTYQIKYPSLGFPTLAKRVMEKLSEQNIAVQQTATRGYDHGMFSPMQIINPSADIPTIQISLKQGLDPQSHIAMGRALAPFREENILIIASGLSYHNLRMFNQLAAEPSYAFDSWLNETLTKNIGTQRNTLLNNWSNAPYARVAHPREEHLLPLMVAVGAAENEQATRTYHETDFLEGISVSNFAFGFNKSTS